MPKPLLELMKKARQNIADNPLSALQQCAYSFSISSKSEVMASLYDNDDIFTAERQRRKGIEDKISQAKSRESAYTVALDLALKNPDLSKYIATSLNLKVIDAKWEFEQIKFPSPPKPPIGQQIDDKAVKAAFKRLDRALQASEYRVSIACHPKDVVVTTSGARRNPRKIIAIVDDKRFAVSPFSSDKPDWLESAIIRWLSGEDVGTINTDTKSTEWDRLLLQDRFSLNVKAATPDAPKRPESPYQNAIEDVKKENRKGLFSGRGGKLATTSEMKDRAAQALAAVAEKQEKLGIPVDPNYRADGLTPTQSSLKPKERVLLEIGRYSAEPDHIIVDKWLKQNVGKDQIGMGEDQDRDDEYGVGYFSDSRNIVYQTHDGTLVFWDEELNAIREILPSNPDLEITFPERLIKPIDQSPPKQVTPDTKFFSQDVLDQKANREKAASLSEPSESNIVSIDGAIASAEKMQARYANEIAILNRKTDGVQIGWWGKKIIVTIDAIESRDAPFDAKLTNAQVKEIRDQIEEYEISEDSLQSRFCSDNIKAAELWIGLDSEYEADHLMQLILQLFGIPHTTVSYAKNASLFDDMSFSVQLQPIESLRACLASLDSLDALKRVPAIESGKIELQAELDSNTQAVLDRINSQLSKANEMALDVVTPSQFMLDIQKGRRGGESITRLTESLTKYSLDIGRLANGLITARKITGAGTTKKDAKEYLEERVKMLQAAIATGGFVYNTNLLNYSSYLRTLLATGKDSGYKTAEQLADDATMRDDVAKEAEAAEQAMAEKAKANSNVTVGKTDQMGKPLEVRFTVPTAYSDKVLSALADLPTPSQKYDYLNGLSESDRLGVKTDRLELQRLIELNRAIRLGYQFAYFSVSPRKGHFVIELAIDVSGKVAVFDPAESASGELSDDQFKAIAKAATKTAVFSWTPTGTDSLVSKIKRGIADMVGREKVGLFKDQIDQFLDATFRTDSVGLKRELQLLKDAPIKTLVNKKDTVKAGDFVMLGYPIANIQICQVMRVDGDKMTLRDMYRVEAYGWTSGFKLDTEWPVHVLQEMPICEYTSGSVAVSVAVSEPSKTKASTHTEDDGSKPEKVTASVVQKSLSTASKKVRRSIPEMRNSLLAKIDDAMESAPDSPVNDDDKVVFDIEGNGRFTVANSKSSLSNFRKQVEKDFKKVSTGQKRYSDGASASTAAALKHMLTEDVDEYSIANAAYMALQKQDLRFAQYKHNGNVVIDAIALAEPFELEGVALISGFRLGRKPQEAGWVCVEPTTGGMIGYQTTSRKAAVDSAKARFKEIGTKLVNFKEKIFEISQKALPESQRQAMWFKEFSIDYDPTERDVMDSLMQFDSFMADGHFEHVPVKLLTPHVLANAMRESEPFANTPVLLQMTRKHELLILAGLKRYQQAIDRHESTVPAIILSADEGYTTSVIKQAMTAYRGHIDPVALSERIEDHVINASMAELA